MGSRPRTSANTQPDIGRRLPGLLVFRAAVAIAVFALTLAADLGAWPLQRMSVLLYGVVIGSFVVVLVAGVLLRAGISPLILSGVHLSTALLSATMVVEGTGGVSSTLSFLYLLAILDGAILGGAGMALAMAAASSVLYGAQLVAQLYELFPSALGYVPPPATFATTALSHLIAFYLSAWLAGQLAQLLRRARTEASDARHDLRRAEIFHAEVLEALPVGVAILEDLPTGGCLVRMVNAAACQILGMSEAALLNGRLPDVVEVFCGGGKSAGDATLARVDGPRDLHLLLSRLPSAAAAAPGAAPFAVLVLDDRTEVRALEEKLHRRERLAGIGQMSAAIAHELRNPLAAISGCIELVSDGKASSSERAKLISIVLREIDRLNGMVTDFLAYARPPAPTRLPIDVVELARDIATALQRDAAWDDHPLRVHAPAQLCAEVDPSQLRQVLWNLLKNAVEVSPPGAAVDMRFVEQAQDLCIEVQDHGAGISAEARPHLFEPFFTSKAHGTGLGLAVVYNIVSAHGGKIDVISASDGTTMRVMLPRSAI